MNNKVFWHEGMLLLPQHFQQQERYFDDIVSFSSKLTSDYSYGLIDLELDLNFLSRGEVAIKKCIAVLPEGTILNIPEKDEPPKPIKIENVLQDQIISLGLISSEYENQNKGDRYFIKNVNIIDENQFSLPDISFEEVAVKKLSLKFIYENDARFYSAIPILKIKKINPDESIELDPFYIPPFLNIYFSEWMSKCLFSLEKLILNKCCSIIESINLNILSSSDSLIESNFLSVIGRYKAKLNYFNNKKNIHPEKLYELLFLFVSEIAIYRNERNINGHDFYYDRFNLYDSFSPLLDKINNYIISSRSNLAILIKSNQIGENLWKFDIKENGFFQNKNFILEVDASDFHGFESSQFSRVIKIAPLVEIKNLIYRSLPGIDIYPCVNIPKEIHYKSGFFYFSLNQDHELWKKVISSNELCIFFHGEFVKLKTQLWIVKK